MITAIKNTTAYTVVLEDQDYCIYSKNGDYPIAIYDSEDEALKALVELTGFAEVESNS